MFTAVKYAYLSVSMNLNMFVMYCHKKLPGNKSVKTFCSYDETTDRAKFYQYMHYRMGRCHYVSVYFYLWTKQASRMYCFFLPNLTNTYAVLKCTNNSYISEIL